MIALERGDYALARDLLEDAQAHAVEAGTWELVAFAIWGNRALSYLLEGRVDEAEPWVRRSLTRAHQQRRRLFIFFALLQFAVVIATKDPERSALLYGAGQALRAELGVRLERSEEHLATQLCEDLAAHLGDGFFDELMNQGAEMELDDAVALALS